MDSERARSSNGNHASEDTGPRPSAKTSDSGATRAVAGPDDSERHKDEAKQRANREQGGLQSRDTGQNTATGRDGQPALRLDMDLGVDVQLKAKIEGDITLALLDDGTKEPEPSSR